MRSPVPHPLGCHKREFATVELVGAAAVSFLKFAPPMVCQLLWLAPYPTIREVIKKGTTEGLPPLGYFSMLANGYLWCAYGYVAHCDFTIIVPNITGTLAGAYYRRPQPCAPPLRRCAAAPPRRRAPTPLLYILVRLRNVSYTFTRYDSKQYDLTVYKVGAAAAIAGTTGVVAMMAPAAAQAVLGWAGVAVVVAMFSGPLQVIAGVVKSKSTRNLPFPMAVATVANCTLWGAYGALVIHDPFIWAPNVLGLASGLAQLGLFAKYGIHRHK
jgi:solute carrier family 50 protein (sugar transporter)